MIGQINLLNKINKYINDFPRFSIITGAKGSGKKTICKEIAKKLNIKPVMSGIKIDDIRQVIDSVYTQFDPILYIIPDADSMSVAAKNSLLKITEEPPRSSYFIMTLLDIENTLSTLKSRGMVFKLDTYTQEELVEYKNYKKYTGNYDEIIKTICLNTGQVDELFSYDVKEFYNFVCLVRDNIHLPSNGNAFKLTKKIKIKETDAGFDLVLFLQAMEQLFYIKAKETRTPQYLRASIKTADALRKLRSVSINKLSLLDLWIIEVRSVLQGV